MIGEQLEFRPTASAVQHVRLLTVAGGLVLLLGFFFAPQRVWPNLLVVSQFVLGIGLAGIVFVALQYVCGATWAVPLRRVPEALSAAMPTGAALLALVLLGKPSLYPWFRNAIADGQAFVAFKQAWLTRPFFLLRAAAYLVIWFAFARAILTASRRQDQDGALAWTNKNERLSAAFLVVFAFTFWLASYDWVMSLEPRWYSTVFGIYNFSGLFTGGLAAIVLLVVWLRQMGMLRHSVAERQLVDLGTLLFAMSTFWAYIWFCQYMLIWYANIPEETSYFVLRSLGRWTPLFVANFFLNWVVPFLVLMPRASKRSPRVLTLVALVVLGGRWLDLYLMVVPSFAGERPWLGLWEIGALAFALGLTCLVAFRALARARLVPVGDPYLAESAHKFESQRAVAD